MSSYVATLARKVGNAAEFVHRSAAPVDDDGAEPVPSFLKQAVDDVNTQLVRGKPFSLADLPAYIDAVKNLNTGGLDDRKFLLEKVLVLMSRLPDDSQFSKTLQNFVIDTLYKDLPHPPSSYLAIPALLPPSTAQGSSSQSRPPKSLTYAARSPTGAGYNPLLPLFGAAGSPYARTVPSTRIGSRQVLPDAGLVFDVLLKRAAPPASQAHSLSETQSTTWTNGNGNASAAAVPITPHPGGISSLFFAFADLVIHSIFHTSPTDPAINLASSYLDLSPLYGSSEEDVNRVRRKDGRGKLWDDVFADSRLLFMPPSVCALLVLFCRNHNYIADKILAINEFGTYATPPPPSSLASPVELSAKMKAQDDEIFARARLVNCGFFVQVILGDYVGAILGLAGDGLDWRLDPLGAVRMSDHEVSPRGQGNVVSVEFNLLYRWHATLSAPDTQWTEKMFNELFAGQDFSKITPADFHRAARKYMTVDADVRKWSFDGPTGTKLARSAETNRFADSDLATILQNATEASASAFKARGIPEVLRVIEVMGIEQSRAWGTCSLNEFRKFMGLKPYTTFKDWNPDPAIHTAAETLYEHIDNLELHVGMQAEDAKPAIPGSGLCPGYTISRAILADAVALTRGDPFLTTEFTTYNLTSWGYQDCFSDKNDGSYGGMLTRLLFRTLPDYYPVGSVYAHFPFLVPGKVKEFLSVLRESPVGKYTYTRPPMPQETVVVDSFKGVRDVLDRRDVFDDGVAERLETLAKGGRVDIGLVNDVLTAPKELGKFSQVFLQITTRLIKENSIQHVGKPQKYIDIVKDVINLVPVHFLATQLVGLPIKTSSTPDGVYTEKELSQMFADVSNYIYLHSDPQQTWVLREKSAETAALVIGYIRQHLQHVNGGFLSLGGLTDSVIHWVSGEDTRSHEFLKLVTAAFPTGRRSSNEDIAKSVFAATVTTAALYAKAVAQVVDFYLDERRAGAYEDIAGLCRDVDAKSDKEIMKFVREALRLNPPVPDTVRTARSQTTLHDGRKIQPGQTVYCSIAAANRDSSVFGPDPAQANYEPTQSGLFATGDHGLVSSAFFEATVPQVLRVIFALTNLRRAPGESGVLNSITQTIRGYPEQAFVNFRGQITPFPASMILLYEA